MVVRLFNVCFHFNCFEDDQFPPSSVTVIEDSQFPPSGVTLVTGRSSGSGTSSDVSFVTYSVNDIFLFFSLLSFFLSPVLYFIMNNR